ncbi:MAG: hypothetical protein ACHQRK_09455, partial [Gemmatimonadales bacterium]
MQRLKTLSHESSIRPLPRRLVLMRVFVALAAAGLLTTSCDVHGVSEPGSLSSLSIAPNPQTLPVGGTQQFSATGQDASGASMAVTPVWTVVAGGGTISSSGLFTAGTTTQTYANTVKATSGALSSTATVSVNNGPRATIAGKPTPQSVVTGASQLLIATVGDAGGNVVPLTAVWSVTSGGGSIVAGSGLFTAGSTTGTFTNTVKATS